MTMKGMRFILVFLLVISVGSIVSAQSVAVSPTHPFQEIWDAIHALEARFDQLKSSVMDLIVQFDDFKNTTNESITNINGEISGLKDTDENLQIQIMEIDSTAFFIDRTKMYEVVNDDPKSNTAFCNDNNDILLFGYCASGSMGELPSQFAELYDGFTDYEYTSNPVWSPIAGNWSIGNVGSGLLEQKITCFTNNFQCEMTSPTPFTSDELMMGFDFQSNSSWTDFSLGLTDKSGLLSLASDNGYMVHVHTEGTSGSYIALQKITGGTNTVIKHISGFAFVSGMEYTIKVERDSSGLWNYYVDGIKVGEGPIDQSHDQFTHTHLRSHSTGTSIINTLDDVKVNNLDFNTSVSGILNAINPDLPLGIQCMQKGVARTWCLEQN